MKRFQRFAGTLLAVLIVLPVAAFAKEVTLTSVQFPERQRVTITMEATREAPRAEVKAKVVFKEGQGQVEIAFKGLRPAVLYGGDVTSYVLWAVTRDGRFENLGELWVRNEEDQAEYATGLKAFALLITAETHYLVDRPSEMVMFVSRPPDSGKAPSESFTFDGFGPAPAIEIADISRFSYSGADPLDLLQADRIYGLAERSEAGRYAPEAMREARVTLAQARSMNSAGRPKQMLDYSRRSVSFASEALRVTARAIEQQRIAEEIARRRAEMEALEARIAAAIQAQLTAEEARQQLAEEMRVAQENLVALAAERAASALELERLSAEKAQAQTEMTALASEKEALTGNLEMLSRDKATLAGEMSTLTAEKAELMEQKAALEVGMSELISSKETLLGEAARLTAEKADLELGMGTLRGEKEELVRQRAELEARAAALAEQRDALERRTAELEEQKAALSGRLEQALSGVAETYSSARGYVVNLPDILFAVNKADLKPEAQMALAKLSGILSMMPELNLRVEGHTDSTGTEEWNRELSELRAGSVTALLDGLGIEAKRMARAGYGWSRPLDDNATSQGRARNRRVEVIIAEGTVAEAPPPG